METNDLIILLESLLGPVVADLSAPVPHELDASGGEGAGVIVPQARRPGTITALLSSRPPVGLAILDAASLQVIQANAALAVILGRPGREREAAGHPLSDLAPNLGDSEVEAAFQQVTRTGQPFAAVVLEERTDGPAFLRCALSPLRRADGSFDTLLLTALDVTQELEARQLIAQRARAASRGEDDVARAGVRADVSALLAQAEAPDDAMLQAAERIAQAFGDCCAVFVLEEGDQLRLAALHHHDASQGFRLRAAFTEEPPQGEQDLFAQVALTGNSLLATPWGPQHLALVASSLRDDIETARVASLACVPMRAGGRTCGALMLFSARAEAGGSARTLGSGDIVFLQEIADLLAQLAQSSQLRAELHALRAERNTLLEMSGEGIAVYDAQGRLRQLNGIGRLLLTRPTDATAEATPAAGSAAFKRSFLAPDGAPLAAEDLPWTRALGGERIGDETPQTVVIEWADGTRRPVLMRAWPILNGSPTPVGAVVTLSDASQAPGAGAGHKGHTDQAGQTGEGAGMAGGDAEWARWRETMELLDEAVVLCAPTGEVVFINTAARELLNLPGADPENNLIPDRPLWQHMRLLTGDALQLDQTPVANALSGQMVRSQPTAVRMPGGSLRPIYWDARRIDRASGDIIGVALVAWPPEEEDSLDTLDTQNAQDTPDTQAVEPMPNEVAAASPPPPTPPAPDPGKQLAKTALLPGRRVARWDPTPPSARPAVQTDLTEVCAREARAHRGTQRRRLEIRLPRRRVMVPVAEDLLERAVGALISTAADSLPASVPLHVAVWVERSVAEPTTAPASPIPPGMDVGEIKTLMLKDGQLPELLPPTRTMGAEPDTAQHASVAVVRVCSPNVRVSAIEIDRFAECRALVDQLGGRAWARVDPVLGPTYSFSLPVSEALEP